LEFPDGEGGLRRNTLHGGGMDIFWKYTVVADLKKYVQCDKKRSTANKKLN